MDAVDTRTGEVIRVSAQGDGAVAVTVDAPAFGRIATVSLDGEQASALIAALGDLLEERAPA